MLNCFLKRIQHDKHPRPVLIRMHAHAYDELTYFISGTGSTKIGESTYPYRSGMFAFYRAGTVHDENNEAPCQVLWTHFRYELAGISLREGVFADPHGDLYLLLQRLRGACLEQGSYRTVLTEGGLAQVIAVAARLQDAPTDIRTPIDWQRVIAYIDENSNTEIDFAVLAATHHYSYHRFRHLFCEKFGISPHAYLLRQRIEHAKLMLENTNATMTDIAFDCGFNSSSQFTNIFKKSTGLTPKDYRYRK